MTEPKSETKIVTLKGKLMYPKLFNPDTKYEPKWTVDLLLDAEGLKEANELALRVQKVRVNKKTKETSIPYENAFPGYDGSYLRIERPVLDKRKKADRTRPVVKDSSGSKDVPSTTSVGNGTDARVKFLIKTQNGDGKELSPSEALSENGGYGMFLIGAKLLNIVPYERKDGAGGNYNPDDDFTKDESSDGGFKVTGNSAFDDDEIPF